MNQTTMLHGITDFRVTPIEEHKHEDGEKYYSRDVIVKNKHGDRARFTFFLEQAIAKVKGETADSAADTKVIESKTVYGELR